jgi:acyl-CoA thioester hydrolase
MIREHEIEIRVRYAETDAMGLVHHSRYWVYFEMGRTELLRARGIDYRTMEEHGVFLVVARCNCRYLKPARYDDVLRLLTRETNSGLAKVVHEYLLYRGNELLTQAETTLACVDASGRVQAIPEDIRGEA